MKDSQSNPNRAADVANKLIVGDEVNLMLVASTPETTNPVATVCEGEGMPVISTMAPWQPFFIGERATRAIRHLGSRSTMPYTTFGGAKTSSPSSPTCGTSLIPTSRVAGCFPMMPTATPGATRRQYCTPKHKICPVAKPVAGM